MTTEHHDSSPVAISPGEMLREAREARGLSQSEVAARLNLRVSLVRDIELDRFDQQTATTFTRGYLKIYARLVGISEDEVVAAYETLGFVDKPFAEMHSFSGRRRLEANENRLRLFSWLVFIALGAGILFWILGRPADKPELVKLDEKALLSAASAAVSSTATAVSSSVSTDSPVIASPAVSSALVTAPSAASALVVPSAAQPTASASTSAASSSVETQVVTAASAATPSEAVDKVSGDVVIRFSGDCWLEVFDAKGRKLLSGVRKAGHQEVLNGEAPFRLVIGAPKYVSVAFKGKDVDMSQFPKGRVARFQLPQ